MRNITNKMVTAAAIGSYGVEVTGIARRILVEDLVTGLKDFGRQREGDANNKFDVVDLLEDYARRGAELVMRSSKQLRHRSGICIPAMTPGEAVCKLYDRLSGEELVESVEGCEFRIRGDKRRFRFSAENFHRCFRDSLMVWEELLDICAM